jgi:hypothetical protein
VRPTLAGLLAAHHVQVTATAATPTSPLAALLGFLPLLLIGALLSAVIRGARRQAQSLGGIGRERCGTLPTKAEIPAPPTPIGPGVRVIARRTAGPSLAHG